MLCLECNFFGVYKLKWSLDAVIDHLDVVGFQESGNKWTWANLTPTGATYGRGVVTFVRPVRR